VTFSGAVPGPVFLLIKFKVVRNMAGGKLPPKQELFVQEYLVDLNGTQAYKRAGYAAANDNVAAANAKRLLNNPKIEAALREAMKVRSERTEITQDFVLEQLARIAEVDITNFVKFGRRDVPVIGAFGPVIVGEGDDAQPLMKTINYVDFKESDEVDGTLIQEVKQGKDGASVKLMDRMKALELLGKHLGMFVDKHELTGNLTFNIVPAPPPNVEGDDDS
jgi:phage terminase small subunit